MKNGRENTVIEESDYRLPTKQPKQEQKPKADPATLEYLERLPWRPFDVEW